MRRLSAALALLAAVCLPFPASPDRYTPIKLLHDRATLRAADEMRSADVLLSLVPFALLLAAAIGRRPELAAAQVAASAWVLLASAWLLLRGPVRLPLWPALPSLSLLFLSCVEGLAWARKRSADPERRWLLLVPLISAVLELALAAESALSIPAGLWLHEDLIWVFLYPLGWASTLVVVAWGAWTGTRWGLWLGAAVYASLAIGSLRALYDALPDALRTRGHSLMGFLDALIPRLALEAIGIVLFVRQARRSRVNSDATTLTEA